MWEKVNTESTIPIIRNVMNEIFNFLINFFLSLFFAFIIFNKLLGKKLFSVKINFSYIPKNNAIVDPEIPGIVSAIPIKAPFIKIIR